MLQKEKTLPADTFTTKLENDQVQGAPVILDRSKPVKLGQLLTGLIFIRW